MARVGEMFGMATLLLTLVIALAAFFLIPIAAAIGATILVIRDPQLATSGMVAAAIFLWVVGVPMAFSFLRKCVRLFWSHDRR